MRASFDYVRRYMERGGGDAEKDDED